jgi:hypothetical protein
MTLAGTLTAVTQDGDVHFRYDVTNEGEEPIDLQFSSAQTHDVVVLDGDEEVWRYSADRMFAQMLQSKTVDAGETVSFEAEWTDPVPGEFDAVAFLAANGVDCEATAQLSI